MAKVLVTWHDNWADEMTVEGFKIFDEAEWESYKQELKSLEKRFSVCFGANEDIQYENGQELIDALTSKKLKNDEAKIIEKIFGDEYGFTQFANICVEDEEEDSEYQEEEENEEDNWLIQDEEY